MRTQDAICTAGLHSSTPRHTERNSKQDVLGRKKKVLNKLEGMFKNFEEFWVMIRKQWEKKKRVNNCARKKYKITTQKMIDKFSVLLDYSEQC